MIRDPCASYGRSWDASQNPRAFLPSLLPGASGSIDQRRQACGRQACAIPPGMIRRPSSSASRAVSVIAGANSGLKQERGLSAGPPGLWVTTASDPVGASVFRGVSVVWVSIVILLADPSSAGVSQSDIRGLNSPPRRRYNRVVSFCDPRSWARGERRAGGRAGDICSPVWPALPWRPDCSRAPSGLTRGRRTPREHPKSLAGECHGASPSFQRVGEEWLLTAARGRGRSPSNWHASVA